MILFTGSYPLISIQVSSRIEPLISFGMGFPFFAGRNRSEPVPEADAESEEIGNPRDEVEVHFPVFVDAVVILDLTPIPDKSSLVFSIVFQVTVLLYISG